jgi:phospholipase/lecithinase/hemolysin
MHMGKLAVGFGLALVAVSAPALAERTTPTYTSITVFGDSLVDAGNIFTLTGGATPNPAVGYFQGRFTNGFNYPDLLSIDLFGVPTVASLQGGTNFAYGGARATTTSGVPDFSEQLALYANYLSTPGRVVDPNGLFVLNFGGNDIFAAQQNGTPTGFVSDAAFLQQAASTYAGGVQTLNNLGARNILLTGFPVASQPGQPFSLQGEAFLTSELNKLSLAPDTTLFRFSYLNFFGRLTADPDAFGLPEPLNLTSNCRAANAQPDCTGFFSFDGTHPTAAVQRALYNDINQQFSLSAVVPEPDTWAMMLVGFGLLGGAMRRPKLQQRVQFAL